MNSNYQKFLTIFLLLIFGSGLAIYVFNLLQGRDLSKSPNFDLSVYNQAPKLIPPSTDLVDSSGVEEKPVSEFIDNQVRVLFRDSFRADKAVETENRLRNFLADFTELKNKEFQVLGATKQFSVNLLSAKTESLIAELAQKTEVAEAEILTHDFGVDEPSQLKEYKKALSAEILKLEKKLKEQNLIDSLVLGKNFNEYILDFKSIHYGKEVEALLKKISPDLSGDFEVTVDNEKYSALLLLKPDEALSDLEKIKADFADLVIIESSSVNQ